MDKLNDFESQAWSLIQQDTHVIQHVAAGADKMLELLRERRRREEPHNFDPIDLRDFAAKGGGLRKAGEMLQAGATLSVETPAAPSTAPKSK